MEVTHWKIRMLHVSYSVHITFTDIGNVFFVLVNLLQMMDLNGIIAFPVAPLFTVILSLVGKMVKIWK
jgi:hypothetical protein